MIPSVGGLSFGVYHLADFSKKLLEVCTENTIANTIAEPELELEPELDRLAAHRAYDVAGPRWRVHSTKRLDPTWVGAWTVKVLDEQGNVLNQEEIRFETPVASTQGRNDVPPAALPE